MGLINRIRSAFYNTTGETGEQLAAYRERAITQEESLTILFESKPHVALGPWQVEDMLDGAFPITSIRRAITNLQQRGVLIKTEYKRRGKYGRPESMWQLNPNREA
jgi:hypothetical protein